MAVMILTPMGTTTTGISNNESFILLHRKSLLNLPFLEKVISLVVNNDESWKIGHLDFPDCFHTYDINNDMQQTNSHSREDSMVYHHMSVWVNFLIV